MPGQGRAPIPACLQQKSSHLTRRRSRERSSHLRRWRAVRPRSSLASGRLCQGSHPSRPAKKEAPGLAQSRRVAASGQGVRRVAGRGEAPQRETEGRFGRIPLRSRQNARNPKTLLSVLLEAKGKEVSRDVPLASWTSALSRESRSQRLGAAPPQRPADKARRPSWLAGGRATGRGRGSFSV